MTGAKDTAYPHLAAFMGGWFHQDFDLVGETVADVVGTYRASAGAADVQRLRADIARFLASSSGPLDVEFARVFEPDVDPLGFAPSARGFLEVIDADLAAPTPQG